ncbi:uncharacterized protein LOC135498565 [Lineus longissimus]|uniref:uncharacterized protein LOC135498565 n=1 Tax=Lineus longissimus TaxID=88925 RepID=UPI00315C5662
MCFGDYTKKRNDRMEKGLDAVYGKDDNPIRKLKKKLRCIQTCGIVWLFLAIILIAIGGALLYFHVGYLKITGDWRIYVAYSAIAAIALGGLLLIIGIIVLICFCHLVKKQQRKLSGQPKKQKKGASLDKQYPVGSYPTQKDFGGKDQSKSPGHLPPIDPDEMKKGKDGKKKKKKKKKQVDPEQGYQVNADTEAMIRPDHHGGVHSGRMDLLNEGIEEAIEPERSHVAHSVPGGSGIYEEPDVVVQTHRGEVHAEPCGLETDVAADGMSYAQKEAAAHAARQRHVEFQAKQREHDAYKRQNALEQEWQDYETGKDGRYSNQGRPIIPPLKSARGPELSNGYAGTQDLVEDQVYAEVDRGVHAAAPGMESVATASKQRRSPPHYGKHSRVSPAPDQPMAMHVGPTKSTHHTSQDVQGADIPTQPIIQHQPQYLPFGFQPMMQGQMPGQPETPYKLFMVAPANTGQPMMMPYPYYMQPMPQAMPMVQPMMAPMYDPLFMQRQGMTVQPPTYQQMQPATQQTHSTFGRLESDEAVVPSVQDTVHSAPTIQLHSAPPPADCKKQTDKQYKELDEDALHALEEFQRIHDSADKKQGRMSSASSVSEEALEETKENVVESAIDMDEMLQKLEEMDKPEPQKQTTIDMSEFEKLVASSQSQDESVAPGVLGDSSDVEEVIGETREVQIESAIDIDDMLQKLDELDAQKGHKVDYEVGSGDEKKKDKKNKKVSDEEDEDGYSEGGNKKKKKKKSKKEDEDSGDEKAKKKKKKKKKKEKGSEDEGEFESEDESDSTKKKKSKKDKDGKKKKKDRKGHQEEVIAAATVGVVESGVDMDAFLGSDKNSGVSGEEHLGIHLHGKPDASERAMVAKLELLEKRVHFVEESVHVDSDEEVITKSQGQKVEYAPAPSYDNEEDYIAMDTVQRTQSAPVEHPPPSFVNSWNEPAKQDFTSDDDDIVMPVTTRRRIKPVVTPRVKFQKNVEVEAPVMPEQSAMIETTPSGHGELELDDVDGFEEEEVITVQRTSQVESAPKVFAMTEPSAGVPEIKVTESESFDDQDVITAEQTEAIESSPVSEEITQNIIKETEAAPMVFQANYEHDKRDLDLHTEVKQESQMVDDGDELVVMETASAIEAVPFVLDEKKGKKKSEKDKDKNEKKKKKKKKSKREEVDEYSEDEKSKKKKEDEEDLDSEDDKKRKSALSRHTNVSQESRMVEGEDELVAMEVSAIEAAPVALEAELNREDEKGKKNKKTKKEKKKKKNKKKKGDEDEDEGFGMLSPINARSAPRQVDGSTSPEPIERSPVDAKMEESAIDEVVTIETAGVVEATPGVLDSQLEIETSEQSENLRNELQTNREDVMQVESSPVEDRFLGMADPELASREELNTHGRVEAGKVAIVQKHGIWDTAADDDIVTVAPSIGSPKKLEEKPSDLGIAASDDFETVTGEEVLQAQEAPLAESGASVSVIQANAQVHETSPISDLLPSASVVTNQEPEPEIKMATSATLESGYVDDVMDFREEPKVESSLPVAKRSVGILDLKSAAKDEEIRGKKDVPETTSTGVVDEVLQIETVPQVENSVDILDLKRDEIGGTSTVVKEKEANKDVGEDVLTVESVPQVHRSVNMFDEGIRTPPIGRNATKDEVEDVLTVESVPQVHRSVDMFDEDIGKPPFEGNAKKPMRTTRLDKKVDILIVGDNEKKDLILSNTSKIPENEKIEVVPDVVPVTAEVGTRDGAFVAGVTRPNVDTDLANGSPSATDSDRTIKMRSDHVDFSTRKEESILLKDRQRSSPEGIGKPDFAPPGENLDNDSLDDFFGNSDITHLLGGDESEEKGNENTPTNPLIPPSRFDATRTQHKEVNGDANNNMAARHTVSPPHDDQQNDSLNNFMARDRQASKRDSLDDGGFWAKHDERPSRRLGRRNRPVDTLEHPHNDENGIEAPSVEKAKHDSVDDLEPLAVPNGNEEKDSVDGAIMWEGDKLDLLQTMKQPKDSDFNTTAFVSRDGTDGVTTVTPFKMESDSEEDILSPMIRKNKKTH